MDVSIFLLGGCIAFAMAWAIGAQDVSNALGTSVGSKALTVRQAIVVGAVCEFLGSLVGGQVAATISDGILNPEVFAHGNGVLLFANCMFVTMCGAFAWLAVATYYGLPVSTTHSLVGSLVGVGIVATASLDSIQWLSVGRIVSSWLSSPLMGGTIAYAVFAPIHSRVLTAANPVEAAKQVLPPYTAGTFGLLTVFVGIAGPKSYRVAMPTACGAGAVVAAVAFFVSRARVNAAPAPSLPVATSAEDADVEDDAEAKATGAKVDPKVVAAETMFKSLMVLTACVVAFAHGSNDVSNSIGPFNALVSIYLYGTPDSDGVPFWVLMGGGIGIVVGLGTYGYKVMATVGEKIAKLTFTRGFAAQIATAATVLTATQMGVSVSTTHCLIGAISGVALVEGPDKLNKATLKKIAMSWIITVPASSAFSVILYILMFPFLPQ